MASFLCVLVYDNNKERTYYYSISGKKEYLTIYLCVCMRHDIMPGLFISTLGNVGMLDFLTESDRESFSILKMKQNASILILFPLF